MERRPSWGQQKPPTRQILLPTAWKGWDAGPQLCCRPLFFFVFSLLLFFTIVVLLYLPVVDSSIFLFLYSF